MNDNITVFVGLDVHKESIAIAVAHLGRAEPRFVGTCGPELRELLKALCALGTPAETLIAYEAGPSGFALARQLATHGWHCQVIAVSKTPRKPGERIKTDRRDALALARYLRSGDLSPVVVPDATDEAIRDLSRAREDAVRARLKARQQLKAMLLRHGKPFPGKTSWGAAHERYLARVAFDHPAQQIAFAEYRSTVLEAHERVERITAALREQIEHWRFGPVVRALMCFKGIDFIAAAIIVAELGDLRRFEHPRQLMAYLGLVPTENSTGPNRRQGGITKAGNSHARWLMIEAAKHYRLPPKVSKELSTRQQGLSQAIKDCSWKAQTRLHKRSSALLARRKQHNKVTVAIARELTGFVWCIFQLMAPKDQSMTSNPS